MSKSIDEWAEELAETEDALSRQIQINTKFEARAQKAEKILDELRRFMALRKDNRFWYVRVAEVVDVLDGKGIPKE